VGNLIPHGELLSRRSGGWRVEGAGGQVAPDRGAGWFHHYQYAPVAGMRLRRSRSWVLGAGGAGPAKPIAGATQAGLASVRSVDAYLVGSLSGFRASWAGGRNPVSRQGGPVRGMA
jgi:hypothetical protein